MGQSRPLFVYFRPFLITISIIQIEKSIDGVLGIWTRGCRMVGADKTTELWRHPQHCLLYDSNHNFFINLPHLSRLLSFNTTNPFPASFSSFYFLNRVLNTVVLLNVKANYGKILIHDLEFFYFFRIDSLNVDYLQCDQIERFIALWATFLSLWQQLLSPNRYNL